MMTPGNALWMLSTGIFAMATGPGTSTVQYLLHQTVQT